MAAKKRKMDDRMVVGIGSVSIGFRRFLQARYAIFDARETRTGTHTGPPAPRNRNLACLSPAGRARSALARGTTSCVGR